MSDPTYRYAYLLTFHIPAVGSYFDTIVRTNDLLTLEDIDLSREMGRNKLEISSDYIVYLINSIKLENR